MMQQWLVIGIFVATLTALILSDKRPSFIFSVAMLALLACGQMTLDGIAHNLTNKGLIALVLLLLVSNAVDKTALIKRLGRTLVTASYQRSYWRLTGLTFFASALLNNTAVVASLIGPVSQNRHHAASKLLIPLSYAAILGGTVTLIGTSTNLIVDSFLVEQGHPGFNFWDFTRFGLIAGLATLVLIFFLAPLLPNIAPGNANYREYFIEAEVRADSELVGKSIEQNHLRNLPELFLVEVVRRGKLISPVNPDLVIQPDDKLIFSGNIHKVEHLHHIQGLELFAESNGLLRENLTEVVISNRAQLIGRTLKEVGFRALFDAAVVAIRRDGETLSGKLGEIPLQAGDFLLLATGPDFDKRNNLTKNFFIVSEQQVATKLAPWQDRITLWGFLTSIALAATDVLSLPLALLFFLALLAVCRVTNNGEIKRALPINLVVVIVGALSLAQALQSSGVIASLTSALQPVLAGSPPWVALIGVYLVTLLLTELVTNNAAAALMFPFAYALTQLLQVDVLPFALAVAFAASASFISPYGYQTNLLVFSATDYKVSHFARIGGPVSLCFSTLVLALLIAWFPLG